MRRLVVQQLSALATIKYSNSCADYATHYNKFSLWFLDSIFLCFCH